MNIFLIYKYLSTFSSFEKTHLVAQTLKVAHKREKENCEKLLFESRK